MKNKFKSLSLEPITKNIKKLRIIKGTLSTISIIKNLSKSNQFLEKKILSGEYLIIKNDNN